MTQRTFRPRFSIGQKSGIALFTLLAFYFFWQHQAIIGLLVMIIVVGMVERVLHTQYTFLRTKPIDRDEEHEFLIIDHGRFSSRETVPVGEIVGITTLRKALGMGHSLLITLSSGQSVTVEPQTEETFIAELRRRMKLELDADKQQTNNDESQN